MKRNNVSLVIGLGLVLLGGLLLMQTMNIVSLNWDQVWPVLFGLGGLAFLTVFFSDHEQWWSIIPGFTLLGLAALIGLSIVAGEVGGAIGAGVFMGSIALAFWVIYILRRSFWWAVIPAGTLTTLAVIIVLSNFRLTERFSGGVFFLGLALTFLMVALLPTPEGRMRWAFYPAAALLALSLIVFIAVSSIFNYIWPVALIAGGVFLLLSIRKQ